MSLDITLRVKDKFKKPEGSGIFVRRNGQNKEITRDEWDRLHPGKEPVTFKGQQEKTDRVFDANITHNLGEMALQAGLYHALWRPEEKGWKLAKDIIPVLEAGLQDLYRRPTYFEKFNPDNGWGSMGVLMEVVAEYLEACRKYPDARIEVSR